MWSYIDIFDRFCIVDVNSDEFGNLGNDLRMTCQNLLQQATLMRLLDGNSVSNLIQAFESVDH